jgi:hypothetical protein
MENHNLKLEQAVLEMGNLIKKVTGLKVTIPAQMPEDCWVTVHDAFVQDFGVFGGLFDSCFLQIKVGVAFKTGEWISAVSFIYKYTHPGGGRNGHSVEYRLDPRGFSPTEWTRS